MEWPPDRQEVPPAPEPRFQLQKQQDFGLRAGRLIAPGPPLPLPDPHWGSWKQNWCLGTLSGEVAAGRGTERPVSCRRLNPSRQASADAAAPSTKEMEEDVASAGSLGTD